MGKKRHKKKGPPAATGDGPEAALPIPPGTGPGGIPGSGATPVAGGTAAPGLAAAANAPLPVPPEVAERLERWGEALAIVLAAAFIALRPLVSADPFGAAHNLALSALPLVAWLGIAILRGAFGESIPVPRAWVALPLAGFLLLVLASPLVASSPWPAAATAGVWFGHLALFQLVGLFDRRGNLARTLLAALVATVALEVIYALYQWAWIIPHTRDVVYADPEQIHFIAVANLYEFVNRLWSDEPYGTFVTRNSLAGFLALALPLLVWIAACGSRRSRWLFAGIAVLAVALLLITRSRGGLAALGTCVGVLTLLEQRAWLARHRKPVLVAAALLAAAGAWAAFFWDRDPLGLRSPTSSMGFRIGYWGGAVRMIEAHPLLGVGLDNFADHYLRYKSDLAGEVQRAHNDWLQIAAELGIPGLIAFLGLWAALLVPVLRGTPPGPVPAGDAGLSRGTAFALAGIAGGLAVFASEVAGATQIPGFAPGSLLQPALVAAVWFAVFAQAHGALAYAIPGHAAEPGPAGIAAPSLRHALAAGVASTLVHSLVDMNLYVHNFSAAVLLLGGVLLAANGGADLAPIPPQRRRSALAGAALLVVTVAAGSWLLVGRLLPAESLRDLAHWGEDGLPLSPRRRQEVLLEAVSLNPWDPAALHALSSALHEECRALEGTQGSSRELAEQILEPCERLAEQTLARAPENPALTEHLSAVRADHAEVLLRHARAVPREREADEAEARALFERALEAARLAVDRYPGNAHYRVHLGRLLDRAGRRDEATPHWRRARELHDSQILGRLQLPEATLLEVGARLGG